MSEAVIEDQLEVRMDKEEDIEDMLSEDDERTAEASGLFANDVDLDPAMDTDLGNLMTKNCG
jgi:hypothetical protein